jgi:hypothetical protein
MPGLQQYAPYIMGAGALANGDVGGAAGAIGGKMLGDAFERQNAFDARNAGNRESLFGSLEDAYVNRGGDMPTMDEQYDPSGGLTRAHRSAMPSLPPIDSDPVTGRRSRGGRIY